MPQTTETLPQFDFPAAAAEHETLGLQVLVPEQTALLPETLPDTAGVPQPAEAVQLPTLQVVPFVQEFAAQEALEAQPEPLQDWLADVPAAEAAVLPRTFWTAPLAEVGTAETDTVFTAGAAGDTDRLQVAANALTLPKTVTAVISARIFRFIISLLF